MRSYTAWVIQFGKGDYAEYFVGFYPFSGGEANVQEYRPKLREALQFARRSDARRMIECLDLPDVRAVEKQFG